MSLCDRITHGIEAGLRALLRRPAPASGHDGLHLVVGLACSSMLVGSVVHLFHDFLAPIEVPAFTLASNVASRFAPAQPPGPATDPVARLALVVIDQGRFDAVYEGSSPLDRCQLASDLDALRKTFKTVAVDLDLSPTLRRDEKEGPCQARLDQVLDALGPRALLIRPIGSSAESAWMRARRQCGAQFGAADLDLRYGMVRSYTAGSADEPHFAELLGDRLRSAKPAPPAGAPCAGLPAPQTAATATDGEPAERPSYPVIFNASKRLHDRGRVVPVDAACVTEGGSEAACASIEHVLVGGSYGSEDEFITPIGTRPGMEVHAAIAASPRYADHPLKALAVDVLVGLGFGLLLHKLWGRYHRQRLDLRFEGGAQGGDPRLAYGWLVLLALAFIGGLLLLALFGAVLFSHFGIWISPAAMAVGMAIDGFVLGGVESADHLLRKFRQTTSELPQEAATVSRTKPGFWSNAAAALPCGVGLGIIAWANYQIFAH